jgi:hypothetical protein
VVNKLLREIIRLVQDIGADCQGLDDSTLDKMSDNEGIDVLVYATLRGIRGWMQRYGQTYLTTQLWWDDFLSVLKLLVNYVSPL